MARAQALATRPVGACAPRTFVPLFHAGYSSKVSSRRCGSTDWDIRIACDQPGRIASGVTLRAGSADASAALFGRPQHCHGDRPRRDVDHRGQLDFPVMPSFKPTRTSSGVEPIAVVSARSTPASGSTSARASADPGRAERYVVTVGDGMAAIVTAASPEAAIRLILHWMIRAAPSLGSNA